VNVSLINQKVRISLISNGQQIDPLGSSFHNLYRVTLKNGEIWAVDTTGAQHGYEELHKELAEMRFDSRER